MIDGNNTSEKLVQQLLDELGSDFLSRLAKVMEMLAEGRPVLVGEVMDSLHLNRDEAEDWLVKNGAEFNAAGNLVGLGLTNVPTPHEFQVNGHNLYAWCAGDTLIFPVILGRMAHVVSSDPISGAKVRLTVTPNGVEEIEPRTAVLSWPTEMDSCDIRGSICYPSNWFASRETAEKYMAERGGVTILTPDEFRGISGLIGERINILSRQQN